ncbi:hypothetical protein DV515_00003848 [Chloebia gouldiae]|uniref:Uncharacterized protein n=1 Tax=Chloebia gouldiae TaxID=44316 RepID=A0A3L8STC8_CHLGU|nr:hypothetical protein DV515_00003848 [Chloebia gouldiae]
MGAPLLPQPAAGCKTAAGKGLGSSSARGKKKSIPRTHPGHKSNVSLLKVFFMIYLPMYQHKDIEKKCRGYATAWIMAVFNLPAFPPLKKPQQNKQGKMYRQTDRRTEAQKGKNYSVISRLQKLGLATAVQTETEVEMEQSCASSSSLQTRHRNAATTTSGKLKWSNKWKDGIFTVSPKLVPCGRHLTSVQKPMDGIMSSQVGIVASWSDHKCRGTTPFPSPPRGAKAASCHQPPGVQLPERMGNTRDAEVSPGLGTDNAACLSLLLPWSKNTFFSFATSNFKYCRFARCMKTRS